MFPRRLKAPGSTPGPAGLHPVVRATGWVSFFTDLGSELIYPLLPDFVTRTLGASRRTFGLIEGLAEGLPALLRLWSGALADRAASRKGLVFAGYLISSCVKPFIGMAHTAATVLGLRVFDRVGKGIRTAPRDAIVADFAGDRRGRAFGFQRAMDHAGAVGGGLLGFALLRLLHLDLRWAIGLSAIPGLLALVTILLFVHDPMNTVSTAMSRSGVPGSRPMYSSARATVSRVVGFS